MRTGRWKVIVFMSVVMATITTILALLLEVGTIPANATKNNAVMWRVGLYGSLIVYITNGLLALKFKETWSRASLVLMLVFTATRFVSWNIIFWVISSAISCAVCVMADNNI